VVSGDNFRWLQSYGGRLYFWAGGSIWSYDGVSRRAEREPVYGTLLGMTVAGLFLVVCTRTGEDSNVLWLLDQGLWTRLEQGSGAGDQYRAQGSEHAPARVCTLHLQHPQPSMESTSTTD